MDKHESETVNDRINNKCNLPISFTVICKSYLIKMDVLDCYKYK